MTPTHQSDSEDTNTPANGCQSTSQKASDKAAVVEEVTSQRMPKRKLNSEGQKTKLDFKKSKAFVRRKQRLKSLIRVLKKFQQAGSQNPQLKEKIKMFEDQLNGKKLLQQ